MRLESTRWLYGVAALFVLMGLALRVVPARVATPPAEPITVAPGELPPSGAEQAEALLTYEGIARSNIFSQERTPPAERYVPPELALQAAEARPSVPATPRLRLFGVAVGPTGSVALIDADPQIPGAEVYRVGDMVAGASLIEIGDTAVVLEGPRGREVLTLPSSSRRSP
ncbi:MAG: hypothetical protein JSU87_11775 [Gemmatimonadota bacterium]|nr:MAG: hypothetical protein JSU87_11775 [Gemmatimonadota bacterium]